jgi:uncharacterized membrane protein
MLVHFPIAFWALGTLCDGLALLGIPRAWPQAWLFLAIGLATAVPALIAGLFDFARLEEKSVAVGQRHMLLMGTAWTVYLAALLTRSDSWAPAADQPGWVPIMLSMAGFLLMVTGGWYGGQLVYKLGAGVQRPPSRE